MNPPLRLWESEELPSPQRGSNTPEAACFAITPCITQKKSDPAGISAFVALRRVPKKPGIVKITGKWLPCDRFPVLVLSTVAHGDGQQSWTSTARSNRIICILEKKPLPPPGAALPRDEMCVHTFDSCTIRVFAVSMLMQHRRSSIEIPVRISHDMECSCDVFPVPEK